MPVLRTKVEPSIALWVLLLCVLVGGICGGGETVAFYARAWLYGVQNEDGSYVKTLDAAQVAAQEALWAAQRKHP